LRRSWKRVAGVTVGILAAAYLATAAALYAVSSEWLAVARLDVHGNSRISTGEVHALLEGALGSSMISADLEAWRQRLLASPWVGGAELRRVFPNVISVHLVERTAAALGRIDGVTYLVDRHGDTIDEFGPRYAELNLPIIDGLGTGRAGDFVIDPARARLTARLLSSLESRPDLLARISQIDVSNVRDVKVLLTGDTALVRIGRDHFVERIQSYIDLAARLRERVPDIDSVDLRYDTRVYVKPQPAGRRGRTS
jgi:cell division septal protein FtsQ